ncbi:antitoxin [Mycetocola spongiae]|uniref:antitoxin n=1 Tax=Mycetocola spongiae TaxID=2859226 RepID=UPI001CF42818|nr:antitoxin [Mycetocola spongiae]UCR88565.1 antitoxin [Mycetocola spongiae]
MAIDDLVNKAKGLVSDNAAAVNDVIKSEKAEEISDNFLDGAADLANKLTGGKFTEQVQSARDAADKAIGNE